MSLALYRKYRSATFADLIGQEHIAATLRNQVRGGEVSHAYLFSGIRGTGKTSSARILARAVNCLHPLDGEPDNTCSACVEILGGGAVDVLEIDAASNRGIDEMRDLREKVKFSPALLRRKVYIVDEAHMLTEPAWNAFLKTLEEPPDHVLFVLATTEPNKVPETVRSRVQRFDFRRVTTDDLARHLARVVDMEGASAGEDALLLVAQAGQGSVRDALSVLDQALATGERPLTIATVRQALGLSDPRTLRAVLLGVAGGDPAATLRGAGSAFDAGADARQLLREMARLARGAELCALGYPEGTGLGGEDLELCRELAGAGRPGLWVDAIDRFAEAEINLRQPVDARLQVELALLRLAHQSVGLEERVARLEAAAGGTVASVPRPAAVPPVRPGEVPAPAPVSPIGRLAVPPPPSRGAAAPSSPAPAGVSSAPPPPPLMPPSVGAGDAPAGGRAASATPGPVASGEGTVPARVPAQEPVPPPVPDAAGAPAADAAPLPVPPPPSVSAGPEDLDAWTAAWPQVIDAVDRRDRMLAGVLRSCRPVDGGGGRLIIGAPYGFHLEKLLESQKAALLSEAVAGVAGRPVAVEAHFSGEPQQQGRAPSPGGSASPADDQPDATSAVLAAFPGARLTGSVLRDHRFDGQ